MTTFIVVISHHTISTQRCFHFSQCRKKFGYKLTPFLVITSHQQYIGMLCVKQTYQTLQPFLLEKAFIMQVRNKGDTETIKGFGNITMGELVSFHPVDPRINRRYTDSRTGDICSPGYNRRNRTRYPGRGNLPLFCCFPSGRKFFESGSIRSKQPGHYIGAVRTNGIGIQYRTGNRRNQVFL